MFSQLHFQAISGYDMVAHVLEHKTETYQYGKQVTQAEHRHVYWVVVHGGMHCTYVALPNKHTCGINS